MGSGCFPPANFPNVFHVLSRFKFQTPTNFKLQLCLVGGCNYLGLILTFLQNS